MPNAKLQIEVLGFDCHSCRKTYRLIVTAAEQLGVPARIVKVTDPVRIASLGVLRLPGVAIEGRLVHQGGIPNTRSIALWLSTSPSD